MRKPGSIPVLAVDDIEEGSSLADRLLFWLLKHPYQRREHLTVVFQVQRSTISRHLTRLCQQGLVEAMTPASTSRGNHPDVLFTLSNQGLQHVAELVGNLHAAQVARLWKVRETDLLHVLPRLPNILALEERVLGLIAETPSQLAFPGGHRAAIRWHWQQDYVHTFERKSKRMICRADAVVVIRCRPLRQHSVQDPPESWYGLLLLFDPGFCGSEDLRLMQHRLEHLLHWRESHERWSVYRCFPPVLILAPTMHQRDLWIWRAQEAATHLHVAPLKGACAVPESPSPWHDHWWNLDGSGPLPLQRVIEPLVPEALPPGLLAPRLTDDLVRLPESTRRVVTGNFQARARRQNAEEAERTSRMQVSLLSIGVSPRSQELARSIYAMPLIAPHELAALQGREETTIHRYLRDLYRHQIAEAMTTSCGKRLCLTETGLRLLAAMLGVSLSHLAQQDQTQNWQQRGIGHLLRTMEHTAGIYGFLADLQRQAHARTQKMLWWETTRSVRRYRVQGAWHQVMPDASFAYQTQETRVEAWLEWDTGSMHLKPMRVKFEAYAHAIRSHSYWQEHRSIPRLLLVVPQTGREVSLRSLMTSVFGTLPLIVWTTTMPLIQAHGPLDAIWKPLRPGEDPQETPRSRWIGERNTVHPLTC